MLIRHLESIRLVKGYVNKDECTFRRIISYRNEGSFELSK